MTPDERSEDVAGPTARQRRRVEGGEVVVVGVEQGVEVRLGGGDLSMTRPVHDGSVVGAAGEQPGGVRVAQFVDADADVEVRA